MFFCREAESESSKVLHRVSSIQRICELKEAVMRSGNEEWHIQLPPDLDVLAADINYHTSCWTRCVFNTQREIQINSDSFDSNSENTVRLIEFVEDVKERLEVGVVLSLGDIEEDQKRYGLKRPRWRVKELLVSMIPGVEFSMQKNRRKTEMVHLEEARREAIQPEELKVNGRSELYLTLPKFFEAKFLGLNLGCSEEVWTTSESLSF